MPAPCAYVTAAGWKCVWTYPQPVRNPKHTIAPSQYILYISHTVNVLHYICFTFTQGCIQEHTGGVRAVAQWCTQKNTNMCFNSIRVHGNIKVTGRQEKWDKPQSCDSSEINLQIERQWVHMNADVLVWEGYTRRFYYSVQRATRVQNVFDMGVLLKNISYTRTSIRRDFTMHLQLKTVIQFLMIRFQDCLRPFKKIHTVHVYF